MNFKLLSGGGLRGTALVAEYVDVAFLNVQGATITLGLPVAFTTTAASLDGAQAVLPAASQTRTMCGVAIRTVPNNGIGFARSYGYLASVAIYAHGTSVTIAVDSPLGASPSSLGLSSTGLITAGAAVAVALEAAGAAVCSPGGYIRAFIRGM